ncbi:MAG: hypothetical protein ACU836_11345 [Gammaproteobacteria bacterium]
MKYIIKQLSDDFIFEEMEQVRRQFVEALNYTMESATVFFDKNAQDPLDFYIAYDFQQKHGEHVVYGFNLRDELFKNFKLDSNKYHSSKLLLAISQRLKNLAVEIEERYDAEPTKTLAAAKEKKDAEYAKSINRSYREVLKEAIEKDKAAAESNEEEFVEERLNQTILINSKSER